MKELLCVLTVALIFSCAESSKKEVADQSGENAVELQEMVEGYAPKSKVEYGIPVYNFPALNEALLQKKTDTTYVVNFWATWCKP